MDSKYLAHKMTLFRWRTSSAMKRQLQHLWTKRSRVGSSWRRDEWRQLFVNVNIEHYFSSEYTCGKARRSNNPHPPQSLWNLDAYLCLSPPRFCYPKRASPTPQKLLFYCRHRCYLEPLPQFCHLYLSVSCMNAVQKKQLQLHTFSSSCFSVTASPGRPICPATVVKVD